MTKSEYMKKLSYSLRRLPKEDFNQAIDYFEEYFAEAGEENEQQAIEDLGSPGAAVIGVIGGAALLIQSLPDGLATLGFSLCCGAVGIMSVYGIFCFLKWLLYKVAQLLGKIMKGGKKNEKNN